MSMKVVGVKVPVEIYEKIKKTAEANDVSLSEFVRNTVIERFTDGKPNTQSGFTSVAHTLTVLESQLQEKDKQLASLQADLSRQREQFTTELSQSRLVGEEASKRSDTIIAQLTQQISQMTQQLDRTQSQLEDMRGLSRAPQRLSWFRRLFGSRD